MSAQVRLVPYKESGMISMAGHRPSDVAKILENVLKKSGFQGLITGHVRKISTNNVKDVAYRSFDERTGVVTVAVRLGENIFSCRLDLPAGVHPLEIEARLRFREEISFINHESLKAMVESKPKLQDLISSNLS